MDDESQAAIEEAPEDVEAIDTEASGEAKGSVAEVEGDKPDGDAEAAKDTDWRTAMAGEDKELAKMLKRFGSQAAVARALADTKSKLSQVKTAAVTLPEDASDDEKAAWRKARDIPDAPDAYDIALKGIDWTDDDKAVLGDFTKVAHSLPVPLNNAQVKGVLQWYADKTIADQQEQAVAAQRLQQTTVKALKTEYGTDYERNVSLMKEFGQAQLGGDGWEALVGARLADGTNLGDNPAFIRLIVESALDRGDGLPFEAGGTGGGSSDGDLIQAHRELSAKASSGDREAKRKMADPEYEKRITAAYERQEKRAENKRSATA